MFLEVCLLTCGFEMLFTCVVPTPPFLSILEALEFASLYRVSGEGGSLTVEDPPCDWGCVEAPAVVLMCT